jgi:hypothetical protein
VESTYLFAGFHTIEANKLSHTEYTAFRKLILASVTHKNEPIVENANKNIAATLFHYVFVFIARYFMS